MDDREMSPTTRFHVRARREASRLRATAKVEVPDLAGLERSMDELVRVAGEARKAGRPGDAGPGWDHNANAVGVAGAMALRTGQAVAELVRGGYAIETAGLVRKLGEITQHAVGVAQDPSGDYARNWGYGRGKAGKASSAYTRGTAEPDRVREKWEILSKQEHANFGPFVNLACWEDETDDLVFPIMGMRHAAFDAIATTSAAWDMFRVAAAFLTIYPQLDEAETLALAERLKAEHEEADRRITAWTRERLDGWESATPED